MLGITPLSVLLTLVALCHFVACRAQGIPFLSNEFPSQYHIQTDQGPSRYFRFQTLSGQFRKERRNPDGSVVGSYGWVDPNGVLRLFDYISDAGGYRIEKQRLFKVGTQSQTPYHIASKGGNIDVGFEVFPINVDSHNPDGAIGQVIESRLGPGGGPVHGRHVSSLTSNFDVANPLSRQNQATYFEVAPPPPTTTTTTTPKPFVIGAALNRPKPGVPRERPFVIGAAHSPRFDSRPAVPRNDQEFVIGAAVGSGDRSSLTRPATRVKEPRQISQPTRRRDIVVIGLRHDKK